MEKAASEFRSAPPTNSEEVTKRHAEELRALEERLVAKHQEELNKATEAAIAKVKESQPAPAPALGTDATPEDQKAAIDAAVTTALATREAEEKTKHDAAIEKAVESGRLEGTMKLRLKDTQLVRAQNRVKELEKQIEEWKKAGVITSEAGTESTSALTGSSSAPAASPSAPSPTTAAPPRAGGAGATGIPRKPSVAGTAAGQPARGRGRGGVRGNIGIRGAAAPGAGRVARGPQDSAGAGSTAGGTAGVAIMGAASKRPREEGEVSTEDSLPKRMKPATAAAATTSTTAASTTGTTAAADGSAGAGSSNTGGKPVTLQRNRVQPS